MSKSRIIISERILSDKWNSYFEEFTDRLKNTVDSNNKPIYRYEMTKTVMNQYKDENMYKSYLFKNELLLYGPIVSSWHSDDTEPKEVMAKMFLNLIDNPI
jgi:hypothetical protein